MDIKLPINPHVRQFIENELTSGTPVIVKEMLGGVTARLQTTLPLVDGLYQEHGPRLSCGEAFILNYSRFADGLLTDDQADKFLIDTLKHLRIAHLKVIHPQLDIDGMIMHLVRERFEKTSYEELKDLCIQKRDPEPLHPRNTHIFEMLKGVLVTHATKIAPMAIALGQSKGLVLKHLKSVIDESLTALDITPERCPHIRMGFLHHFLIAYPELWGQENVEPYHFLGEPMIHMAPGRGMCVDKAVAWGEAGKSLIRNPGRQIPLGLTGFTLDYLVSIDPGVLDAKHLLREGTRSAVWLDRCHNLESGLPILERLLAYGVVHPALWRIDVVSKLSEEGKRSALLCYANGVEHPALDCIDGVEPMMSEAGKRAAMLEKTIPVRMAQAIVESSPDAYDQAFSMVKKFSEVQRLADLKWPSDEQLLKLSPKNKRLLLEGDLEL